MATKRVLDASLTSIANAIRTKGGTAAQLTFPAGFVTAIENIPTGGGGSEDLVKFLEGEDAIDSIPDGTTKIRSYAFYNYLWDGSVYTDFLYLTLPNSVEEIGACAFQNSGLREIIGGTGLNALWGTYAFADSAIQRADFSNSAITLIPQYCFSKCSVLASVSLPATCKQIGAHAFDGTLLNDTKFAALDLEDVEYISDYAFYNCFWRTNNQESTVVNKSIDLSGGKLKSIGNNVFATGNAYAYGNNTLKNIDLSDNDITSIGVMGPSNRWPNIDFSGNTGLTAIPNNFLASCKVNSIDFTGCGLETIGEYAFQNQTNLLLANIDFSNLTSIGQYAFEGCTGLSGTLDLSSLTTIGRNAFKGCTGLTGNFELDVATIGNDTFFNCRFSKVTLGSSLTSIGSNCFGDNPNLTEAHFNSTPSFASSTSYPVFRNCTALTDLYVPWSSGAVDVNKILNSAIQGNVTIHYDTPVS